MLSEMKDTVQIVPSLFNVETNEAVIDALNKKLANKVIISQLMRSWYLPHRRQAKAHPSLRICAVSPEPSLFAHMKYGSRRRVPPKIRHLAPLDGCTCAFEE